jgi:uncharacterized RDD family membrane protein YckC
VILTVVSAVFSFGVALAAGGTIEGFPAFVVYLVDALIFVGYFAFLWTSRGQSIGMMATGLRVTRSDGSPLTMGRAVGRALVLLLSLVVCLIGAIISSIMVGTSQRKQGLHDLIADTVVVHK